MQSEDGETPERSEAMSNEDVPGNISISRGAFLKRAFAGLLAGGAILSVTSACGEEEEEDDDEEDDD